MYITILQENLKKALSIVGKAVPVRPQLPILSNVLLDVSNGQLVITATNLETTFTVTSQGKVEKEGKTTVPARAFSDFVNTLPAQKVELRVKGDRLTVLCQGYTATFIVVSADTFVPLPQRPKKTLFTLKSADIAAALSLVVQSAATDEGRPVLTGVYITQQGDGTVFAATDGFRLSVLRQDLPITLKKGLLVPARALQEVVRLAKSEEAADIEVFVAEQENQVFFSFADKEIVTRLVEGSFPEYQKIIPQKHTTRAVVDREDFLHAVKAAAVFAREASYVVGVKVSDNAMVVSAAASQIGKNTTTLAANVEGSGGEMSLNSRFLSDFLSNVDTEQVVLEMTEPLKPGVLKAEGDDSLLHIIMPVRVQN